MPDDVPLDEPRRLMTEERFWDASMAVTSLGVVAAVVADSGWSEPVAVLAVALVAVLWCTWGRRVLAEDRQSVPFAVATLVAFGIGVLASSVVSYLLFAVCPAMFVTLPLRRAVVAVTVANLTPILAGVVRDGGGWEFAVHIGPIFVMTALISAGIGIWITRMMEQSQERLRLIAELDRRNAEVDRLSRLAGAADERSRLAREIHDTLAQGFTSIITLLQAADPELRDERLRLAVTTARENLAESRALVAALSPPALDSDSLVDAVRRQTERAGTDGTSADFRITGEPVALPTRSEVVLLRAAQEALTNVRRHAGARHVDVVLGYGVTGARLRVRDDGCGFDPAAPSGFGLDGMRARAAQVGGSLVVTSAPGAGTTVEVEVPA